MYANHINALWLSDIHFSVNYKVSSSKFIELRNYFNKFRAQVKSEIEKNLVSGKTLDYIFLTGDLAQSGTKEDYDAFFQFFLAPLLDEFIAAGIYPKVITIPGNHDVNWKNKEFLNDYLKGIEPRAGLYKERYEFLQENEDKFNLLFSDYSDFLLEKVMNEQEGKYKPFFELVPGDELLVSNAYQKNRLFGYIIDHQKRLIIVLLNTAWFSLGGGFNNLLAELKAGDAEWEIDRNRGDMIKLLLKIKENISEYSNQISGINLFEIDEFLKIKEEFNDYFQITCMHHPLNWLQWNENYSYGNDEGINSDNLNGLLKLSNLILSGHEHIPKTIGVERISDSSIGLKSGCFLFDNQATESNLDNGWFSFLRINADKAIVHQDRCYWNNEASDKNWKFVPLPNNNHFPILRGNNNYNLHSGRKGRICGLFSKREGNKITRFLNSQCENDNHVTGIELVYDNHFAFCYLLKRPLGDELCIVAKDEKIYTSVSQPDFMGELERLIAIQKGSIKVVRFLILDFFVDKDEKVGLHDPNMSREERLHEIVHIADNLFDVFRHKFFVRFEEKFSNERTEYKEFDYFRNINFANCILPFWVAENFWRS
ncbi:metallophosphoesterase family protein [Pedobacter sp. GR22-10]|uniref:metallophosphoesterase family protein n=1 Tax=Pedobacter sp. GR22-10 TaxID=2994472 RepID=UPI0022482313|nr:metallophosphoesterase [Pedobacter sp. GR22-10]MCX2430901.1 metallophosphoesterase [Pedobacter sp. GR22-10]